MNKLKFTYAVAFLFVFSVNFAFCNSPKKLSRKPNIVYLLADDMGMGDLTCYNPESKIPTPSMDALSKNGMMFMDAHTNSAVCSPTRYSIMTGSYSFRSRLKSGVLEGSSPLLIKKGTETVASLLKKYGYKTACFGKWHLGLDWQPKEPGVVLTDNWKTDVPKIDFTKPILSGPNEVGFDYFFGIPASLDMPPYLFVENHNPQGIPDIITNEGGREGLTVQGFKAGNVMPELTKRAVAYIKEQSSEQPFFLYFPWTAPHTPIVPNPEFQGKSSAGKYGDFVTECDETVKKIVTALKEKGLLDNTLIILTSDNGSSPHGFPIEQELKYNHNTSNNYKGRKSHSYEGGHRVPFIVSWPGKVQKGTVSGEVICSTDLFATLSEILGHKLIPSEAPDSYSFLPVILQKSYSKPLREATIHHSSKGDFSIRKGDWKYIDARGAGGFTLIKEPVPKDSVQLYNMASDPYETKNVFREYPQKVKELKNLLEKYKNQGYSRKL